jgi:hypothetical protein
MPRREGGISISIRGCQVSLFNHYSGWPTLRLVCPRAGSGPDGLKSLGFILLTPETRHRKKNRTEIKKFNFSIIRTTTK